ncbi:MAG: helix-turn-helix domain-containing protein [Acidimicrobiia bacterium]
MVERTRWNELKGRRQTLACRRGYLEAEVAFRLGARVRAEREGLEMTQAELAARMSTTQPSIARLEAGGVTPSIDTLQRAADALGLELVAVAADDELAAELKGDLTEPLDESL